MEDKSKNFLKKKITFKEPQLDDKNSLALAGQDLMFPELPKEFLEVVEDCQSSFLQDSVIEGNFGKEIVPFEDVIEDLKSNASTMPKFEKKSEKKRKETRSTDEKNNKATFLMETQSVCPHKLPISNKELICASKINLKEKEIVSKRSNRKEKKYAK